MFRCLLILALALPPLSTAEYEGPVAPAQEEQKKTEQQEANGPDELAERLPERNPTERVLAAGDYRYRVSDVEALTAIAERHLDERLSDEQRQRLAERVLVLLSAREKLLAALAELPPAFDRRARDKLVLDLLDYQAERNPDSARKAVPTSAGAGNAADAATPGGTLIEVPELRATVGRKEGSPLQIRLGFAVQLGDTRAPNEALLRDAVIGRLHRLGDELAQPDHERLKRELQEAVDPLIEGPFRVLITALEIM